MEKIAVAFEAESHLIAELDKFATESAIVHFDPVPINSPADALDSPISPADIKLALEMLSLMLTTASAAAGFIDELLDLVNKNGKKVVVRNPRTGTKLGMLVSAEVNLGSRTVMEYLLSPVQKVTHEAGRER